MTYQFQVYNIMIQYVYIMKSLQSNYHLSPHTVTIFFLVMRTLKIYCLSNFQIYNTELSTVVTMLYMTSHGIYFITGSLYLSIIFIHFALLHPPYQVFMLILKMEKPADFTVILYRLFTAEPNITAELKEKERQPWVSHQGHTKENTTSMKVLTVHPLFKLCKI